MSALPLTEALAALALSAPKAGETLAATDGPTVFLELLAASLACIGSIFCLLASIGIIRFPDVYTRMQAATKAGTLGVGCLVLAVPAHFASVGVFAEAVIMLAFFFLTAPVAGHLIGRAAYIAGSPIWARTSRDELRGCYCHETHMLHPIPIPRDSTPPRGPDGAPRDTEQRPADTNGVPDHADQTEHANAEEQPSPRSAAG